MHALVLGDAATVYDDAEAALTMFNPDAVAATNNIGIEWPGRLDYWATLHAEKCPNWPGIIEARRRRISQGRNRPQVWGHKPHKGVDRDTGDWSGSTGLFTVKVLLEEGFTRIVLAGVPMSGAGGYFYQHQGSISIDRYRAGWTKHLRELAPFVRSLSGWTREQLGEPTQEWLAP